jgi:hypothetical protein
VVDVRRAGIATELHLHHMVGAGHRADDAPKEVTLAELLFSTLPAIGCVSESRVIPVCVWRSKSPVRPMPFPDRLSSKRMLNNNDQLPGSVRNGYVTSAPVGKCIDQSPSSRKNRISQQGTWLADVRFNKYRKNRISINYNASVLQALGAKP